MGTPLVRSEKLRETAPQKMTSDEPDNMSNPVTSKRAAIEDFEMATELVSDHQNERFKEKEGANERLVVVSGDSVQPERVVNLSREDISRQKEKKSAVEMLESWINLCTDGAVQIALGDSEAGEVIRNGKKEWIMGYNRNLGKCLVFNAELWGVLDGLALIHERRYDGVLIQTDSLEVAKAIQDPSPSSSNSTLIRRINVRLWAIQHFPREHN
ncbi:hypothetical protein Gotur_032557 [Gossypium turneri]